MAVQEGAPQMIDVYGGNSPNVIKVTACLEELGVAYRRLPLDILKGEQFTPQFLAISPNNRIPAIIDHAPADGAGPLPLFESGAILVVLDKQLRTREFVIGDDLTIADFACWPWTLFHQHHGVNLSDFPEVERWGRAMAARPAARRALDDFEAPPPKTGWTAEERKILFEQGR